MLVNWLSSNSEHYWAAKASFAQLCKKYCNFTKNKRKNKIINKKRYKIRSKNNQNKKLKKQEENICLKKAYKSYIKFYLPNAKKVFYHFKVLYNKW